MSAREIIKMFGGTSAAAEAFGTYPTKVSYWKKVDRIPYQHIPTIKEAATRRKIKLTAEDFLPKHTKKNQPG